jgi:hypothetical protein
MQRLAGQLSERECPLTSFIRPDFPEALLDTVRHPCREPRATRIPSNYRKDFRMEENTVIETGVNEAVP